MSKKLAVALAVVVLASVAAPSMAHRYRRNADDNPMRLIGYVAHPVGLALEYAIFRPVHWLASQSCFDIVMGHRSYKSSDHTHFEWTHGDYSPSIKDEQKSKGSVAKKK